MRLRIFFVVSLLSLALAGCGGSSGGSASTGGSGGSGGSITSAPVQGLSTPTRVSIVDAK